MATIPAIRIPAVSLNLTLPWFTGKPYALYAHVRAVTTHGASKWSSPFGFNMRWDELPTPMATRPGLIRWQPVEGATSYQVWYPDIRKSFQTSTNVADEREFYSFHEDPNWWSTVRWRVRAVRQVLGTISNGLPAVSYGPWSPTYAATNPALTTGKLQARFAASDVVSFGWKDGAHQLMPGLTFTGDQDLTGQAWPLFRVYAFTDKDCVNVVFRGSVVGGPAFAPRSSGPLKLPTNSDELDLAMAGVLPSSTNEGAKTYGADGTTVTTSETMADEKTTAKTDLPDVDPQTTRYYWTVVPVGISVNDSGVYRVRRRRASAGCLRGRSLLRRSRSSRSPRSQPRAARSSRVSRRRVDYSQAPGPGPSSTRRPSSPGSPSSPRTPTRSSGRDRSIRGGAPATPRPSRPLPCSSSHRVSGTTESAG